MVDTCSMPVDTVMTVDGTETTFILKIKVDGCRAAETPSVGESPTTGCTPDPRSLNYNREGKTSYAGEENVRQNVELPNQQRKERYAGGAGVGRATCRWDLKTVEPRISNHQQTTTSISY